MTRERWLLLMGLLTLVPGCSGPEGPGSDTSNIDQGLFYYECVGGTDPMCDAGASRSNPDLAIGGLPFMAVGGSFGVTYVSYSDPDTTYPVRTNPALVSQGNTFAAPSPGVFAFIGTSMDDYAEDLIHARFVEATEMRISIADTSDETTTPLDADIGWNPNGTDSELDPAEDAVPLGRTFLRAVPTDDSGKILAGALPCAWSSDHGAVDFLSDPQNNVVEVQINDLDTLTVNLGGLEQTLVVGAWSL